MGAPNESAPDLSPGDIVADKYRVTRELGRGGMGVVLAADHLLLHQLVALKLMLAKADGRALERFQREARVVAQLQSQHVCKVIDVGTLANGAPFMVMEMLDGETLTDAVRRGPLPIADAVDYVLQACEALAEAHLIGVVHRDIKPSNLFLARGLGDRTIVKVLDFGISKIMSADGHTLTATGELVGSPRFMSPEQLQRHLAVDMRTDVWAIGAVLYELVTGQRAFEAPTLAELVVVILQEEPSDPKAFRLDVPDGLVAVIVRCLQKDANRRFANVAELALALRAHASAHGQRYVDHIVDMMRSGGWSPSAASSMGEAPSAQPVASTTVSLQSQTAPPVADTHVPTHSTVHARAPIAASGNGPTMVSASRPRRGGRVAVALGALALTLGGVGMLAYRQLADDATTSTASDDDGGESKSSKRKSKKSADKKPSPPPSSSGPRSTSAPPSTSGPPSTPDPQPSPMVMSARTVIADAVKRNDGHDGFLLIRIYSFGLAKVDMQDRGSRDEIVRQQYNNSFYERSSTRRDPQGEIPMKVFTTKDFQAGKLDELARDASKRIGDAASAPTAITIHREPTAVPDVFTDVTIWFLFEKQGMNVKYWGDGAFRCMGDDRVACPESR